MLPDYQLKIVDDYTISISNFKKLVHNFFDKKVRGYFTIFFKTRITNKKRTSFIRI